MGDNSAVALAQTAHLSVILRHSSLALDRFLSLSGLGPRSGLVAGLLIDDFALFDRVPKNPQPPDDAGEQSQGSDLPQSAGARSIAEVRLAYEATGLPRHPKKAIAKASRADLWGGAVDGESGLVWPALRRTIPIGFIVLQAATLGLATPELLEALSGSLVSALLSILQRVYSEARDVPRARSGA